MTDITKASHQGELQIGDITIPCAVLGDGTRLLTQSGLFLALGRHAKPSKRQISSSVDNRPPFLAAKNLEPFITDDLQRLWTVVRFKPIKGAPAYGYRAEILPHLCGILLDAQQARALLPSQEHLAKRANILLRGFAHVGIVALVDEATGYQEVRARDELNKILQAYVLPELLPWTQRFPNEFYQQLFRLLGWPYDEQSIKKRPGYVGKLTNEFVYDSMPKPVVDELKRKTPKDEKGRRKNKLHQWLTEDIGHPHLQKQLTGVITLMRATPNINVFRRLFRRAYPGPQQELPGISDEDVPEES